MIDFSKFEKVYEWDGEYGCMLDKNITHSTFVYLIRIGEDFYIDETSDFTTVVTKHLQDLMKHVHPNKGMQDVFQKYQKCEFYIIEQVGMFERPKNRKEFYITSLSPTLNKDECNFSFNPNLWRNTDDCEEFKVSIPTFYLRNLKSIAKGQGVPIERFIEAATVFACTDFRYRNSYLLMKEGVAALDTSLIYKDW